MTDKFIKASLLIHGCRKSKFVYGIGGKQSRLGNKATGGQRGIHISIVLLLCYNILMTFYPFGKATRNYT